METKVDISDGYKPRSNQEQSIDTFDRYSLYPIKDEVAFMFHKKQELMFWTEDELDFPSDIPDYKSCSPPAKRLMDYILAYFLVGDGAVSETVVQGFLTNAKTYEEKAFMITQVYVELVHAKTYGLAALTFLESEERVHELCAMVEQSKCIQAKINFIKKWQDPDRPYWQRLAANACVEGIHFSNLFLAIFWFKSTGKFTNFGLANELISGDETLHRNYYCHLAMKEMRIMAEGYASLDSDNQGDRQIDGTQILQGSAYQAKFLSLATQIVHQIVQDAVAIEDMFTDESLPEPIDDLQPSKIRIYTRVIADNLLYEMKQPILYKLTNPYPFMDNIGTAVKGNFHEVRIGAYKKRNLLDALDWKKRTQPQVIKTVSTAAGVTEVDPFNNPDLFI